MQLKSNVTSQFKPFCIKLNTLVLNSKKEATFQLPKKSTIKLKYYMFLENCIDHIKLYQNNKQEVENPNYDDLKSKYSICESSKPKIIKVNKEENKVQSLINNSSSKQSNTINISSNAALDIKSKSSTQSQVKNESPIKKSKIITAQSDALNELSSIGVKVQRGRSEIIQQPINLKTESVLQSTKPIEAAPEISFPIKVKISKLDSDSDLNLATVNLQIERKSLLDENFKSKDDTSICHISKDSGKKIKDEPEVINDELNKLTYLNYEIKQLDEVDGPTFCEGFFVAGLDRSRLEMIHSFDQTRPNCEHKDCSVLFAYKPKIITKVQKKSKSFSINDLMSNLCFPQGIKLCFHKKESEIKSQTNFMTILTNESGERFYLMTYHYYIKIHYLDFQNYYQVDSVKEYLKRIPELGNELNLSGSKLDKLIESNLMVCSQFINTEFVYIPQCAGLISRYPYASVMEECLESYVKLASDNGADVKELVSFLKNIVFEIPASTNDKRVLFYLPYNTISSELLGLYIRGNKISNFSCTHLVNLLSSELIIMILHLLLLEQKIIFICNHYSELGYVIDCFCELFYPLRWEHTLIPVLPDECVPLVNTPTPFIMGIHESQISKLRNVFEKEERIFLVFIHKSCIEESDKPGKKLDKKSLNKLIQQFPEDFYQFMFKELKELKKQVADIGKKEEITCLNVHSSIKETFTMLMIQLFGDYKKHLSYLDGLALFNTEGFLIKRDKSYKAFYSEMTSTQNFRQLLQNKDSLYLQNFELLCIRHVSSINNSKTKATLDSRKRSASVAFSNKSNNISMSDSFSKNNINLVTNNISILNSSMSKKSFVKDLQQAKSLYLSFDPNLEFKENFIIPPFIFGNMLNQLDFLNIEDSLSEYYKQRIQSLEGWNKRIFEESTFKDKDLNRYFAENKSTSQISSVPNSPYKDSTKSFDFKFCKKYSIKEDSVVPKVSCLDIPNKSIKVSSPQILLDANCNSSISQNITSAPTDSNSFTIQPFSNEISIEESSKNSKLILNLVEDDIKLSGGILIQPDSSVAPLVLTTTLSSKDKERINDAMRSILTSDKFSENISKEIQQIFSEKDSRIYLSSLILQQKFKDNKWQCLNEEGFSLLYKMVYASLLYSKDDEEFDSVYNITKSLFFYYKYDKKGKNCFLSEEIARRSNTFDLWLAFEFWEKWFERDISLLDNTYSCLNDFYFSVLLSIASYMKDLKLNVSIIKCFIADLAKKHIKHVSSIKSLFRNL